MKTKGSWKLVYIGLFLICLAAPASLYAQNQQAEKFTQEQLDQMLAPIALYPDELLTQMFMASTYPIEIVQADRWLQQNKKLSGDALKAALDKQTWDASVKSLIAFPSVLDMMNDKLDWTQNLGDAFLAQQKDVMNTVQKLRKKAEQAGNLKNTQQQQVKNDGNTIIIESANPQVIYVPVYDPTVIYGTWWYPAYPPYPVYVYPPGTALITFTIGVAVGAAWYGWGHGCDWHGGAIIVTPPPPPPHHGPGPGPNPPPQPKPGPQPGPKPNPNHGPSPNPPVAGGGGSGTQWQHNPDHRQGAAYNGTAAQNKYSPSNASSVNNRMDYRGYDDSGGQGLSQGAASGRSASGSRGQDNAFFDMDRGGQAQMDSDRGNQSMRSSRSRGNFSLPSGGDSFGRGRR